METVYLEEQKNCIMRRLMLVNLPLLETFVEWIEREE